LNNDKWHVNCVILVPNSLQGDRVDPSNVGAHDLVDSVPDEESFASHRVSLDFGGVRPEYRVGKVEDGEIEPHKDDSADRCAGAGFASLGIDSAEVSA
jgi:hypothetical protein